jgi:tartrate dehydrogenase/decarboxylase/D-malate dehydrogenase
VFWDDVFAEVAKDYPQLQTDRYLVDAMAARFVTHPETLDVVVASNLFADILTDLGGAIQGSMGMPPSANIDPTRRRPSLFEPVHGSAPDIAGKGIANPLAAIWAGQLMLEFLGEKAAAGLLMQAVEAVTQEGRTLTPDLGGTASTDQVATAVCEHIKRLTK